MINSFKYIFVETTSSWFIGSSHHFLSFSSDGTAIAGTKKAEKSSNEDDPFKELFYGQDHVQFWDTATGAATSSFTCSSYVVFSPTDPNIAALFRPGFIHILKRDSFGGKTWGGQYRHQCSAADTVGTFNSDGKTILLSWNQNFQKDLREYDATTWSQLKTSPFVYNISTVVRCPIKPGWFVVGDQKGELEVVSNRPVSSSSFRSHGRLIPINSVGVSACAWSQDGKWIATGNDDGDTFLWNAGDPACVSFAMLLPRYQLELEPTPPSMPTTSLVFLPDSTALIIICGGYLSVWDIEKAEYVTDSGLPDTAVNIALDGPRNRLAVAADERITIYELKLAEDSEQMSQMDSDEKWKQLITFKSLLYLTILFSFPFLFL